MFLFELLTVIFMTEERETVKTSAYYDDMMIL
jgi:hypothetical protein